MSFFGSIFTERLTQNTLYLDKKTIINPHYMNINSINKENLGGII